MAAVEENRTWELVDPPIGCQPIGLKWVYKVKRNERGEVVRHKARLVAKGFVQREGIDFEEVFAPWRAWSTCACCWLWRPGGAARSITWT